jgi:hypothetical protein
VGVVCVATHVETIPILAFCYATSVPLPLKGKVFL